MKWKKQQKLEAATQKSDYEKVLFVFFCSVLLFCVCVLFICQDKIFQFVCQPETFSCPFPVPSFDSALSVVLCLAAIRKLQENKTFAIVYLSNLHCNMRIEREFSETTVSDVLCLGWDIKAYCRVLVKCHETKAKPMKMLCRLHIHTEHFFPKCGRRRGFILSLSCFLAQL